tara:strand:- start:228 stop:806 length:579 start_codon:yes stop_codon:yes gene_type:complete
MSNYLNKYQYKKLGFNKVGRNCKISKKINTYNLNCSVGKYVRIDDNVTLKGRITIGSNVHISKGCTLSGGEKGIFLENFSTLSNFCQLFTQSDDYYNTPVSGGTLSKIKREKLTKYISKKISIGKASIIGPFGVILPGAEVGDFCTVAPYSCIYKKIRSGYYFSTVNLSKPIYKKRNLYKLKKFYEKNFKNN